MTIKSNIISLKVGTLKSIIREALSAYASLMYCSGPRFDELRTVIDTINSAVTDIEATGRGYSFQDARWALPAVFDRIGDPIEAELALLELLPAVKADARAFIEADFRRWKSNR